MARNRSPQLPAVFCGVDAVGSGALTPNELRGPQVRRLVRGVYCPGAARVTHESRCRAVAMVAPADAVVTGASALTVHGVPLAGPSDPVHVVVAPEERFSLGRDVLVGRRPVLDDEARPWCDRRLATPLRASVDLLLGRPVLDAVPDLDRVLRSGLATVGELEAHLAARHDRGVVLARQSLGLADARSESPMESWTRVVLAMDGLFPTPQLEIRDEKGFVARVDLAFAAQRVVVEYEGAEHGERYMLVRDRQRLDRLREAGWTVVFVTARDRWRPHRELVARVRVALATTR